MCNVLDVLKSACCGLTREQLLEKARIEGIQSPISDLAVLINQGYARIDKEPAPPRYKATNKAWPEVQAT